MSANVRAPVFIIGNPRSGTTLLRLMITCHPRITIPPEAGFLVDCMAGHGTFGGEASGLERFVGDLFASPKFEHWKLSRPALERHLRDVVKPGNYAELAAGVYECYASVHQGGKPRWGDKNNFYLSHIATIASLFPGAVFLHIVRDGRDVACSYRSLAAVQGKYAPRLPGDLFGAIYDWNRNLGRIRRAFDRIGWDRVCELRYEDLVHDPEGVLRRVCSFLGEDFAPGMLAYDRENRDRELEPREFDAWKKRNREGIDASAIGRWKSELSARDAALAQRAAGKMLRRYHYDAAHAGGLRALLGYAGRVAGYRAGRLKRRFRLAATRATSSCA